MSQNPGASGTHKTHKATSYTSSCGLPTDGQGGKIAESSQPNNDSLNMAVEERLVGSSGRTTKVSSPLLSAERLLEPVNSKPNSDPTTLAAAANSIACSSAENASGPKVKMNFAHLQNFGDLHSKDSWQNNTGVSALALASAAAENGLRFNEYTSEMYPLSFSTPQSHSHGSMGFSNLLPPLHGPMFQCGSLGPTG